MKGPKHILVQNFSNGEALSEDGRMRETVLALLRLERDIFGLWCRWLFQPLDASREKRAREAFESAINMVNNALGQVRGGGPFFLGPEISMVDLMFVPFLERQNASLLSWKGFKLRNGGWQNIDRCSAPTLAAVPAGSCLLAASERDWGFVCFLMCHMPDQSGGVCREARAQ
jgi:glutathione S-transferase